MICPQIDIKLLVLEHGKCPFEIWLNSLDFSIQAKIYRRLGRIRLGVFGNWKNLGDEIYEFKIDLGPGYRIYFAFKEKEIIIVYGGSKRTQQKDIEKSKSFWKKYKDQIEKFRKEFIF